MPFLKTTCEFCGEIELPVARVLLRIDTANNIMCCVVRCPDCGHRFVKEANEAMVVMLLAVGIEVSVWASSADADPLLADPDGAPYSAESPISQGELAEFRRRLMAERDVIRHLATP